MRRTEPPPFVRLAPERVVILCPLMYPPYVRSDVCLARLDALGRFRLLSPAWEQTLGFRGEELNGRALVDLLAPQDRRAGATAVQRLLSPAEADPLAMELRGKHGGAQHMHWHRHSDPYDGALFILAESAGFT
jgi:PAS domain S-box-containing protein